VAGRGWKEICFDISAGPVAEYTRPSTIVRTWVLTARPDPQWWSSTMKTIYQLTNHDGAGGTFYQGYSSRVSQHSQILLYDTRKK